jgi:hypothetical protein
VALKLSKQEWEHSEEISALRERADRQDAELRSLRNLVGYLVMDHGRDGEVMIGNGTLMRYDGFTLQREDDLRGGILIRAIPNQ